MHIRDVTLPVCAGGRPGGTRTRDGAPRDAEIFAAWQRRDTLALHHGRLLKQQHTALLLALEQGKGLTQMRISFGDRRQFPNNSARDDGKCTDKAT